MKTFLINCKKYIDIFWSNEVYKSIARHILSATGGYLTANGIIHESIGLWMPGGVLICFGGIWGALNEYWAGCGIKNFLLSLFRHILTALGTFSVAMKWIPSDIDINYLVGVIISGIGSAWGIGDEKQAQEELEASE